MKRLNGWQRIGIILSVIWIIGGGMLVHTIARDNAAPEFILSDDDFKALAANDMTKVSNEGLIYMKNTIDREVSTLMVFWTLGPLVMVWGFVYLVIGLIQWVRAGFRQAPQ
jgi:hypothetical protein